MQTRHPEKRVFERRIFGLRIVNRFRKAEEGVAAIEFGMLALPFLMLIFAILETAIGFFAAQVFESGVDVVGRKIRTGQIGSLGSSATAVQSDICDNTWGLFTCANIKIDVQTYAVFPDTPLTTPRDVDGNLDDTSFGFNTGCEGDIAIVRAYYEWPVFLDYLWQNYSGLSNGARLFVATTAFQNEPFGGCK